MNDLNDLENASTLPNGFEKIRKDSQLIYFYTDENFSCIIASIVINNDLTVTIFFNGKKVSSSEIRHLLSRYRFVQSQTELCNILSLVKSWCTEENDQDLIDVLSKQVIETMIHLIEKNNF